MAHHAAETKDLDAVPAKDKEFGSSFEQKMGFGSK